MAIAPLEDAASLRALYQQITAAISKILAGGQSASIEGNSVTRADLSRLVAWRDDVAAQYYLAAGVSMEQDMDFRNVFGRRGC